jgi:hypothetical protein
MTVRAIGLPSEAPVGVRLQAAAPPPRRHRRAFVFAAVWLAIVLAPLADPVAGQASPAPPSVVILDSYHESEAWSDGEIAGIRAAARWERRGCEAGDAPENGVAVGCSVWICIRGGAA